MRPRERWSSLPNAKLLDWLSMLTKYQMMNTRDKTFLGQFSIMFHHLGRFTLPWTVVPTPLGKCYPKSSTTIIMQSVFTSNVSTSVYAEHMNIYEYVLYSCISICMYIHIYIWVNCRISLIWNLRSWLGIVTHIYIYIYISTMIPGFGRGEVTIIYPDWVNYNISLT